jgi:CheY-like chemotaxis protein
MTLPLALVVYEKLLPGTQLINRLEDLHYRVQALTDAGLLAETARKEKPLVILADATSKRNDVFPAVTSVKADKSTAHIPVIVFTPEDAEALREQAHKAGATLAVSEAAILNHLAQFLDQALQLD